MTITCQLWYCSDSKESAWRRAWQPTPVFWRIPWTGRIPGESLGQGSLAGYSPWGHKESDMTEWLSTHGIISAISLRGACISEPGLFVAAQRTIFLQWAALVAINKEFHPLRGILMGMEENAVPSAGTSCRHAHSCQDECAHMVLPAWLPFQLFSAYLSPNMPSILSAIQLFPVAVVV